MSPQSWLAEVYVDLEVAPPLPDEWTVDPPEYWLSVARGPHEVGSFPRGSGGSYFE